MCHPICLKNAPDTEDAEGTETSYLRGHFYWISLCNRNPSFSARTLKEYKLPKLFFKSQLPSYWRTGDVPEQVQLPCLPFKCSPGYEAWCSSEGIFFRPHRAIISGPFISLYTSSLLISWTPVLWPLLGKVMASQKSPQLVIRFIPLWSHLVEVALHSVACWHSVDDYRNSWRNH